jgi:hypothetical protein
VNRKIALAAVLATGLYFLVAYYFKASYVEDVSSRQDVAIIPRIMPTATPGTFFAHLWLPDHVRKVVVYEDGVSIGQANAVYDDPGRTFAAGGKRWKYVEFNSKGDATRRWLVFADFQK